MAPCPVCLKDIGAPRGVVEAHSDSAGKICPMSGRERFVWDEASTRDAVRNRSGGICEYCHAARGTELHHRVNRSQGGAWSPANCIWLCRLHHSWVTVHPTKASKVGLSVQRGDEPADVPVRTILGVLWLTDDVCPPIPGWAR